MKTYEVRFWSNGTQICEFKTLKAARDFRMDLQARRGLTSSLWRVEGTGRERIEGTGKVRERAING